MLGMKNPLALSKCQPVYSVKVKSGDVSTLHVLSMGEFLCQFFWGQIDGRYLVGL